MLSCRKQLISMINSRVSPYIRGLGFMYIRYTQPPADLWEWFEPYLVRWYSSLWNAELPMFEVIA